MTKLSQILAVEKGARNRAHTRFTELHRKVQQTALLHGITRTYQPRDDEGEQLPGEGTRVQISAEQTLADAADALRELFNVTATKDVANTQATANVKVEGDTTLLVDVPVTTLLFLEKQLIDL